MHNNNILYRTFGIPFFYFKKLYLLSCLFLSILIFESPQNLLSEYCKHHLILILYYLIVEFLSCAIIPIVTKLYYIIIF